MECPLTRREKLPEMRPANRYKKSRALANAALENALEQLVGDVVTIRVDENGKCLDSRYNYHRSKAITRDLEEKYNLHKVDRKQRQAGNPLR